MAASSEPPFLADRPLLIVKSLLLNDFLHEIGHPVGVLAMISFGMTAADDAEAPDAVELAWPRAQRLTGAVDTLVKACEMMRTVGVPSRNAALPHEQWQAISLRLDALSRLARGRSGAGLHVVPAECPLTLNASLAQLEAIAICIIKDISDHLPAAAGGMLEICLQQEEGGARSPAGLRLCVGLTGIEDAPEPVVSDTTRWVAAAFGWTITRAAPGTMVCIERC